MKATVNQKACIQCGLCPTYCPQVFTLTPGMPAQASPDPVPEACMVAVQEAADSCPTSAISVTL